MAAAVVVAVVAPVAVAETATKPFSLGQIQISSFATLNGWLFFGKPPLLSKYFVSVATSTLAKIKKSAFHGICGVVKGFK